MSDFDMYIREVLGLSLEEYSQLKFAVLYAAYRDGARHYEGLPSHLKDHEVGKLVNSYLIIREEKPLNKAAALLTNNSNKPWLFLSK